MNGHGRMRTWSGPATLQFDDRASVPAYGSVEIDVDDARATATVLVDTRAIERPHQHLPGTDRLMLSFDNLRGREIVVVGRSARNGVRSDATTWWVELDVHAVWEREPLPLTGTGTPHVDVTLIARDYSRVFRHVDTTIGRDGVWEYRREVTPPEDLPDRDLATLAVLHEVDTGLHDQQASHVRLSRRPAVRLFACSKAGWSPSDLVSDTIRSAVAIGQLAAALTHWYPSWSRIELVIDDGNRAVQWTKHFAHAPGRPDSTSRSFPLKQLSRWIRRIDLEAVRRPRMSDALNRLSEALVAPPDLAFMLRYTAIELMGAEWFSASDGRRIVQRAWSQDSDLIPRTEKGRAIDRWKGDRWCADQTPLLWHYLPTWLTHLGTDADDLADLISRPDNTKPNWARARDDYVHGRSGSHPWDRYAKGFGVLANRILLRTAVSDIDIDPNEQIWFERNPYTRVRDLPSLDDVHVDLFPRQVT